MIIRRLRNILMLSLLSCVAATAYAELPTTHLQTLDGKSIDTSTLSNNGKPFAISFWATWCKPCRRELKAIHEVYPDWQDETGMKMYAISIDQGQNIEKVKPLVDSEGWEYEVLLDPNSDFLRALSGGQDVPYTVIVDGKGNIVDRHKGYIDGAENEVIEKIRKISE